MWSDKKYVNFMINILLFATAVNLFHYGQFFLPVICLILFVDHHFRIRVKNVKVFVVLCLFALSFFLFSYKLGLYSVMGFSVPMAYYIGGNLKEDSEENVRKLIYLLAFGMAALLVLDCCYELSYWYNDLSYMFNKPSHYDFWLRVRVRTTIIAANYYLISSCIYYLARFEENRKKKWLGIALFLFSTFYCVALGRRSSFLILFISLLFSFTYDLLFIRKKIDAKYLIYGCIAIAAVVLVLALDLFGIGEKISQIGLIQRFMKKGLFTERFEILKKSLPLFGKYLWGGQQISTRTGALIHDLWGDIYDYSGIIPAVCMLVYSFHVLKTMYGYTGRKRTRTPFSMLVLSWFITCSIIFFLEPIMSGSSIYLIVYVMIAASLDPRQNQ
ncbi:MAG: hypothetical protein J5365_07780 [Erysipelotrichaceae bacterium]|nr:hypothetical protein [Erysipelotrichaceae bacterium]